MVEKIGLAATMDMSGFDKGMAAYTKGLDQMTGQTQKSAGFLQNAFSTAMGVFSGKAILGAAKSVVNGLKDMAQTAATIPAIAGQFDRLGGSMEEMRKGSAGLIDDTELMKNFNKAASLVSVDFAKKLPNAMSLLGRAAAASGQDVNYMLESLVTGVGRVSPMILDNLGIQVSLSEATEAYAASLGKSTDELTKQEQQTAVMNVVMAKLEAAYGGMDDVSQSAQAQMAAFAVQMKNFRDQIGVAVLPIMTSFMGGLSQLAARIIPSLVSGIQAATPVIQRIADSITLAFNMISDVIGGTGGDIPWEDMLPPWLADIAYMVSDAFANLQPTIQQIIGVVEGGLAWDKLLPPEVVGTIKTMGATFKSLATMIAAALKQIAPIIQQVLIKHIQTVGAIFKSVFPEIQKTVQATMANFQAIVKQAIPVVVKLFETLGPAITKAMDIIRNIIQTVVPFVANLIRERVAFMTQQFGVILKWVQQNMPLIQRTIETVLRAIQTVWNAVWPVLSKVVLVAFDAVKVVVSTALQAVLGIIKAVMLVINGEWEQAWEALKGVLSTVWEGIQKLLLTLIGGLVTAITGKKGDFLKVGQDFINELWNGAVGRWDLFKADMVAKFATIKDWVVGLYNEGLNIIQGLWDGVKDKWEQFKQDLLDKFNALPEWVRNILGEKSPSKVFIEIGEGIGEGFALGIEASSDEVLEAVIGMADKVVTLVQGMVEALNSMGSAPNLAHLEAWGDAISKTLTLVMNKLVALYDTAGGPEASKIDLSRRLAKTFQDVIAFVNDAVGALAALGEAELRGVTDSKIASFLGMINTLLVGIKDLAVSWSGGKSGADAEKLIKDAFGPARKLVDQILDLFRVFEEGAGAISAVLDMGSIAGIKGKVKNWAEAINHVIWGVINASKLWTESKFDFSDARAFANATEPLIAIVEGSAEAITAISELEAPADFKAAVQRWAEGLNMVVWGVEYASRMWTAAKFDFGPVRDFAAAAGEIVNLVSGAVEAILSLTDFKPARDLPSKAKLFAEGLNYVLVEIQRASVIWKDLGLDAAAEFAGAASEILGLVGTGVDALASLASLKFPPLGSFGVMAFGLQKALEYIYAVFVQWRGKMDELEKMQTFSGSAQDVIGIIQSVVGMLDALATMEFPPLGSFGIMAFGLQKALEYIKAVFVQWQEKLDELSKMEEFASSAQVVTSLVQPVVDMLHALTTLEFPSFSSFGAMAFGLQKVLEYVRAVFAQWQEDLEELSDMADFSASAQTVVGIVQPVLDMLKGLVTLEFPSLGSFGVMAFGLQKALEAIRAVFIQWEEELEELAGMAQFSESASKALEVIKGAVEALAAIADYKEADDLADKMDAFAIGLHEMLLRLADLSSVWIGILEDGTFDDELLRQIALFSSNVQASVSFIKPAIDAIDALSEYTAAKDFGKAISAFKLDLGQVIDALGELAANPNLSADRLEALAEFSSMLNDVIGQLQRGVEALEAIAEYEAGSAVKAFKNLTEDINRAVNYLWNATAVLEGDMGVARATKFEAAATAIHDKVMGALEKLGILGDGSSALSGTTTFSVVMASALNAAKTAIVDFRDTWVPAWVDITNAIRSATQALITFGEKAAETKPPEWAEGHSPPPLAKWMDAIADATRRAKEQFSGFGGGLSPYSTGAPAYATAPVSSSTSVAVNFGDVNINSGMDMALFEARVRRTVKEAIKG